MNRPITLETENGTIILSEEQEASIRQQFAIHEAIELLNSYGYSPENYDDEALLDLALNISEAFKGDHYYLFEDYLKSYFEYREGLEELAKLDLDEATYDEYAEHIFWLYFGGDGLQYDNLEDILEDAKKADSKE